MEEELRVIFWGSARAAPPEVEKLLQSKNFQALGPGQLILDPTLVSGDFGYRLLSWQALEKDLDLRRQLMEGSSDIVELTPDLAAPTQGRVETGRNAPEITEREVAGMLTQAKGRGVPAAGEDLPLREQMEQFERALILARLQANRWRMAETARQLGLERSHLYKKLRLLGIEKPAD